VPAFVNGQGSAFTNQRRLTEAGNPASVTYDMQFKLYDLPGLGPGTQQGDVMANNSAQVAHGVFTVTLDFGASVFNGSPRFIEVGERTSGSASQYLQFDGGGPFSIRMTAQSVASAEKSLSIQNLSGESVPGVNNSIQSAVEPTSASSTKMTITKDCRGPINPHGGGLMTHGQCSGTGSFCASPTAVQTVCTSILCFTQLSLGDSFRL